MIVPTRSPARRSPRSALLAIGLLFVCSALLRLGDGVGRALASEPAAAEPSAATAGPDPSAEIGQVLAALKQREDQVATRESRLADLEQNLALARSSVDARLAELEAAEKRLATTIAMADSAADEDISKLVAVYEAMKPKEAARLFEQMDPSFAAGLLGRMQPDAAAAVLAGVDPAKAYTISVVLAGRNAAAPAD